ncbi:MAG: CBS domain-containing protein [Acidobacteria bacterium]|nr:CBS domain-containing protein [Acidobacteriota bacterium]
MRTSEPIRAILRMKGPELFSLPPDASVYDAIALMSEKSAGALLVMDHGLLAGIISERDYARKVILMGKSSRETAIREIMSFPVIRVSLEETVDECMRIMTARRIRHLPVVDGERVAGIVSIGDIVKWIITRQEETIQQLESYIAGAYPG